MVSGQCMDVFLLSTLQSHSSFMCWRNFYYTSFPQAKSYLDICFMHLFGFYLFCMTAESAKLESFQLAQ